MAEPVATLLKDEAGSLVVNRVQDVEPVLEFAKESHNAGFHGSSEMKHAAEIPLVLIEAYMNRYGLTFHEWQQSPDHIRAMLNDPALKAFRIWPGRV